MSVASTTQSVPIAWLQTAAKLKLLRVALTLWSRRLTTGSSTLRMMPAEFGPDAAAARAALSRMAGARLLSYAVEPGGLLAINLTGSAVAR